MKDFILIQTQLALFFKQRLDRPDKLLPHVEEAMPGLFSSSPLVLPIPDDRHLDSAPVVQLRGARARSDIARIRADIFYPGRGPESYKAVEEDFLSQAVLFFRFVKSEVGISRVGFLTNFFVQEPEPDNVISTILSNEFKQTFTGTTREAHVRFNKRHTLGKLEVNNVVSLQRSKATIGKEEKEGIAISRDINTLPDKDYSLELSERSVEELLRSSANSFNLAELGNVLWKTE